MPSITALPWLWRARRADRPAARAWNPSLLVLVASAWLAGPANWPLWRAVATLPDLRGPQALAFAATFGLMTWALLVALLGLLAWRATLKPAITLLLSTAAVTAHFMGSYGVVIDPSMVVNTLGTDAREVRDLLDGRLLLSLALLAGLPLWWLWRTPVAHPAWRAAALRNAVLLVLGLCGAAVLGLIDYQDLASVMRTHKSLRYQVSPFNAIYSVARAARSSPHAAALLPIGLDARPLPPRAGQLPPLLLLVIGETARADHFALNGYGRDTNPELRGLDVLSFHRVASCGTNTAASLPCMLSAAGRARHEARAQASENLLDLLQRAGLAVLWVENQAGCKEVCNRVPHTRPEQPAPGAVPPDASLCPGGECLDGALLQGLDERLAALPAERRARGVVLVLHQMGSHGPAYAARSPAGRKPFQPECRSPALSQCDRGSLLNAYDNSIAYTDHVLAQAIGWLGRQDGVDPALLYLSDHGESLGENGLYLHGMPALLAPPEQTHVPMIAWLPPRRLAADRLDAGCLHGRLDAELSHDHLFHTVLGLARVGASEYRPALDALAPCRGV